MDEYRTVEREASSEFTERRSRFLGHAKPVQSEEEAVAFINEMKSRYWDANHNVYAYVLRDGQTRRYSDDGEPQGTAGIPVLEVIQKSGLTDVAVVVTRYFGGILLGTGGLVRAYSHGASLAIAEAGPLTMRKFQIAELVCDYTQYGRVAALIPECGGVIDDTGFTDRVAILYHMTAADKPAFDKKLADATSGQVAVTVLEEKYFAC